MENFDECIYSFGTLCVRYTVVIGFIASYVAWTADRITPAGIGFNLRNLPALDLVNYIVVSGILTGAVDVFDLYKDVERLFELEETKLSHFGILAFIGFSWPILLRVFSTMLRSLKIAIANEPGPGGGASGGAPDFDQGESNLDPKGTNLA